MGGHSEGMGLTRMVDFSLPSRIYGCSNGFLRANIFVDGLSPDDEGMIEVICLTRFFLFLKFRER